MNCIIVTEDFSMKKIVEKLIIPSDLHLLSTFVTTSEASVFMKNNGVDVIFFDVQMCDFDSLEFIQMIPDYIPEFSIHANAVDKPQLTDSAIAKRFNESIAEARLFLNVAEKENTNISDDYFVI